MARHLYNHAISLIIGDKKIEKSSANYDDIATKLPESGNYTLIIQHENKVGFTKQYSYLSYCAERLGITCNKEEDSFTFECSSKLVGLGILYLASLCRVAPGNWITPQNFEESKKKILKDINIAGFINFVKSGISGSPMLPLSKVERLESLSKDLDCARKEYLRLLK